MRIVVTGSIGRYPVGGMAWIQMQYLLGLHGLGHDVFYIEDCGDESWVYHWEQQQLTTDIDYPASYVDACLSGVGLGDRWSYRAGVTTRGLDLDATAEILRTTDLLLIWAVPLSVWRPEYALPKRRAFIDADPGFTQMAWLSGDPLLSETIGRVETLFTYGTRIGAADCLIPTGERAWQTTVPPVVLDEWPRWPAPNPDAPFTCVMHWRGHRDVEFAGESFGQKDIEFPKFMDLPRRVRRPLELAVTGNPPDLLEENGWRVREAWSASRTPDAYREFIRASYGEFGVAKHGYVKTRGGWFSDRSVCYLASGRPVVVEETGVGALFPVGEGVHTFTTVDQAAAAIAIIEADYERECRAARQIAENVFDARIVLPPLLEASA